ncbi:MAG: MBOAT family protein [Firmicutes bacterium]|nr:MBOAT family protein [Bacillota bacterium]
MVFSSVAFLFLFFPSVLLCYFALPGIKLKNAVLIVFSLLFYAYGEPKAAAIMIASVVINYVSALILTKIKTKSVKKILIAAVVAVNLGMLFTFKYLDFSVGIFNKLFRLGISIPEISLPIGISFFTFQALSYVIDVYRNEIKVQKNIFKMFLYISFFPQLIAGPIVRYKDIEKQLSYRKHTTDRTASGLRQFIFGLSAKLLLANPIGSVADTVFAYDKNSLFSLLCWIGAVAYTMQIYFDFSGYSNMAIGMGRIFGFDFPPNFNLPFTSFGMKDFWRRWHISLSTWFREYLYIPLGGNRCTTGRKLLNLMTVFAFTGLWHGANFTFIIWGLLHGIFVCAENIFDIKKIPKAVVRIYTSLVIILTFVFFRADNINYAINYLCLMFIQGQDANLSLAIELLNPVNIAVFIFSLIFSLGLHIKLKDTIIKKTSGNSTKFFEFTEYLLSVLLLGLCIIALAASTYNPFIYFRF